MAMPDDRCDTRSFAQQAQHEAFTPAQQALLDEAEFDAILERAAELDGEVWLDSMAHAAGRGRALVADERGFVGVVST